MREPSLYTFSTKDVIVRFVITNLNPQIHPDGAHTRGYVCHQFRFTDLFGWSPHTRMYVCHQFRFADSSFGARTRGCMCATDLAPQIQPDGARTLFSSTGSTEWSTHTWMYVCHQFSSTE